jgi:hypothetical protein
VRIEVVEEAQAQFAYREAWWRANRDTRELFEEEYERALDHLSRSPKSGDQYRILDCRRRGDGLADPIRGELEERLLRGDRRHSLPAPAAEIGNQDIRC